MRNNIFRVLIVLVLLLGIAATILAQDSIGLGDSVTGEADGSDVEYTINLSAGDTVEIDLQSDDFDTLVRVVDASGEELAEDDDGGATGLNSLLTFEAPDDAVYTIVVTSFFGDPEGSFTLEVRGGSAGGGMQGTGEGDLQPGDSITETADGNVSYDISLESGQTVTINVTSDEFDTYLEVLDDSGETIGSDDDGGDGFNSRLVFTAPADGIYTLLIRSFAGEADGEFILTVDASGSGGAGGGVTTIEYGQTLEVNPDGATSVILTFEGEAGDAINLYAVSSSDEDSRIYLYDPDGNEVTQDDDSGEGTNPFIRRFVLPASGTYEIDLQGFGESELLDPLDVTLEQTELIELTTEGVTITLGEDYESEVMAFDAVDDTQYLLSVEMDEDIESSLYIELVQEDEDFAATRFTVSGASSFAAIFVADETGTVRVEIEYFSFSGDTDFTFSIEPLK